jgi:hypothetical protein
MTPPEAAGGADPEGMAVFPWTEVTLGCAACTDRCVIGGWLNGAYLMSGSVTDHVPYSVLSGLHAGALEEFATPELPDLFSLSEGAQGQAQQITNRRLTECPGPQYGDCPSHEEIAASRAVLEDRVAALTNTWPSGHLIIELTD